MFYFKKVIKVKAEKNRNTIINNISELYQIIIFDLILIEINEVENNIKQILNFKNNFEEKDIKTPKNLLLTLRSEFSKITKKFKTKYSKLPKTSRTSETKFITSKKIEEIKEFSLIQLYDFENETEISLTFLTKPKRTESLLFDLHKILETVFKTSYLSFIELELSSTLNTKILIGSEKTNFLIKDSSDSKLDNSNLELNINIFLESKNLENIENTIEMNAKQFTEALKNIGLF